MKKILLVGESWVSNATHYKGWDQFSSTTFHLGAEQLVDSIDSSLFKIDYMTSHDAAENFPSKLVDIQKYSAVIFSGIGSNTILLHPKVWIEGETFVNRLKLIKEYVQSGGSFLMVGGYLSFQGINGAARYKSTPIEEILPVNILPYDDRIEVPEGFSVMIHKEDHEILNGLSGKWPPLLGFNEVVPTEESQTIISTPESVGNHPLLVIGKYGSGKTMAWTSDIGPHWVSKEFLSWQGYKDLWNHINKWLVNNNI